MRHPTVLAAVLGVMGALAVLDINDSPLLPGSHRDGVEYLTAAEALVTSGRLQTPMPHWSNPSDRAPLSHFPPGLSMVLAGFLSAGVPGHAAALWSLALGAGGTIALLFLIGHHVSGLPGAISAAGLVAVTPAYVRVHTALWSEPLFLVALLLALLCLLRWPRRPWLAGAMAALGVGLRYAGLATTVLVTIVAWRQGKTARERITFSASAAAPSAIVLAGWLAHVASRGEVARSFGPYDRVGTALARIPATVVEWLTPWVEGNGVGALLAAVLLLALGGLVVRGAMGAPESNHDLRRLARIVAVFLASYAAVVISSRVFLDPAIPFDTRLGLPMIVLSTLLVGVSLPLFLAHARPYARAVVCAVALVWLVSSAREVSRGVRAVREGGTFYTSTVWINSEVIRWIRDQSGSYRRVYSNEPGLVHFLAGRASHSLPQKGESLETFWDTFKERPGVIMIAYPLHATDLPPEVILGPMDLRSMIVAREGVVLAPARGP